MPLGAMVFELFDLYGTSLYVDMAGSFGVAVKAHN